MVKVLLVVMVNDEAEFEVFEGLSHTYCKITINKRQKQVLIIYWVITKREHKRLMLEDNRQKLRAISKSSRKTCKILSKLALLISPWRYSACLISLKLCYCYCYVWYLVCYCIGHAFLLTLSVTCISESCIKSKISLNFYFHTSLWCLKRFYEGL